MTLPALGLLLALGQAQGTAPVIPPKDRVPTFIVLATGDPALAKRARQAEWNTSAAKFAATFPPARFEVLPWADDRKIVVDRETGILGWVANRMSIERGLLAKIDKATGIVDVAGLSPEEFDAVKTLFGTWPNDPDTRQPVEPDSLGVATMFAVTLNSGGTTRRFNLPPMNKREAKVEEALTQLALGRRTSTGPAPAKEAERTNRDDVDLVYLVPSRDWDEATGRVAEAVRQVRERMRLESERLGS